MRKVCEVLKPVARQCVLVSADFAAVHHVRQVSPYRVGWRLSEYTNTAALKCEALAPDYLFCDHQLLTQSASKLWRGPWRWVVYDVQNGESRARRGDARRAPGRNQPSATCSRAKVSGEADLQPASPMYFATWRSAQLSRAKLSMNPQCSPCGIAAICSCDERATSCRSRAG